MKILKIFIFIALAHIQLNVVLATELTDRSCSCDDTTVCLGSGIIALSNLQFPLCDPPGGDYFAYDPIYFFNDFDYFLTDNVGVGTYPVYYAYNGDTCSFNITVQGPSNAAPIQGEDIVCVGSTETFTITADPTATSYHWWSPELGLNYTGPNNFVTLSNFNTASTINLNVEVTNDCGTGTAQQLAVTIKQASQAVIKNVVDTLAAIDYICQNQQLTYSLSAGTPLAEIQWNPVGGTVVSTNQETATILWGNNIGTQLLEVTYLDVQKGCYGDASRNVVIQEGTAPEAPEIWLFGYNLLVCSNDQADIYKWYLVEGTNTSLLPQSNQPYWYADPTRIYQVEICNENCCNKSQIFAFPTAIYENTSGFFSVYPNPARDNLVIKLNDHNPAGFNYIIHNQLGKKLLSGAEKNGMAEVSIAELPAGLYFITLWSGNNAMFIEKIIKY